MKHAMFALALVLVLTVAAQAQAPAAPQAEVVGIQLVYKGYDYEEQWKRYDLAPFNTQSTGTEIAIALTLPAGGIIALDTSESSVASFKDDKGTDFLKVAEKSFGSGPGMGPFAKVSQDGKHAMFTVRSPHVPVAGATRIAASGTAALVTATTQEAAEMKNLALTQGAAVKLGPFALKIKEVGKPSWGDDALAVTFEGKQRLDNVVAITFHGADGKELETSDGGTATMSFGDMVNIEKEINFKAAVSGLVTMRLTYWSDMRRSEVPFRVLAGLAPMADR